VRYLCSICVRREADTLDFIDEKHRPVCIECTKPVPDCEYFDEGDPKQQIMLAVRRRPGATFIEIREELGIEGGGCHKSAHRSGNPASPEMRVANRYAKIIERMAKAGEVVRTGQRPFHQYWPVQQQRRAA